MLRIWLCRIFVVPGSECRTNLNIAQKKILCVPVVIQNIWCSDDKVILKAFVRNDEFEIRRQQ